MTAICPASGPSQAKPGAAGQISLGALALQALAVNWPIAWAIPYIVGLGAIELNATSICATDPPADPGFTAADAVALLTPQFPGPSYMTAVGKLQQLVTRIAWYQFCECVTGPTPAAPAPPAAPVGLPSLNPTLPLPSVVPCGDYAAGPRVFNDTTRTDLLGCNGVGIVRFLPVPSGATSVVCTYTVTPTGGTHQSASFISQGIAQDGTSLWSHGSFAVASGTTVTETFTFTKPVKNFNIDCGANAVGPNTDTASCTAQFYCGGQVPGTAAAPCCPPDPISARLLEQILATVTLIQRQNVPFGYLSSTVHAGLTSYGTLAISGLLGVRVDITGGLAALRKVGNLPGYYYGGGFITFGTADGYPSSYRVKHSPLLCMPARCSAYTQLEYDLPPGVTISITELVREP